MLCYYDFISWNTESDPTDLPEDYIILCYIIIIVSYYSNDIHIVISSPGTPTATPPTCPKIILYYVIQMIYIVVTCPGTPTVTPPTCPYIIYVFGQVEYIILLYIYIYIYIYIIGGGVTEEEAAEHDQHALPLPGGALRTHARTHARTH